MKTKRSLKAKRRGRADPLSIFKVLGRAQSFTESEQVDLNMPARQAFEALRTGKAGEADFKALSASVNIAMVCAEKIDPLVEQTCITARDTLIQVQHKYAGHAPTPDALADIGQAVDIYEQLTSLMTGGQLQSAMTECYARMAKGQVMEVPA